MSAIAGILYFDDAPVEHKLIERLTSVMASRGPDEQTHWVSGSVALGHCMLRTTPESLNEHQPLISEINDLAMVWDGRLDNRDELSRSLNIKGALQSEISDAELVLRSYIQWREKSPEKLLGDFAFAVWDAKHKQIFCARDHMGARPFYYVKNEQFFAFSSEEESLLELPGVSVQPNEERIAYFLLPSFQDFGYTDSWLNDIWALGSGQFILVTIDRTARKKSYWQLEAGKAARYASVEECQESFLEVFGEAVRCRMRTIGDVSAMVSGGLDSASITAMVKRLIPGMSGKQFHSYSALSDHPDTCVESRCIQSLTRSLGEHAHYVSVPSFRGMLNVEDLTNVAWSRPHPVDGSLLLQSMLCLAASRDGHRVMLHGVSGDLAMYAPYNYISWWLRTGQWWHAWKECQAASRNNTYLRGITPLNLFFRSARSAVGLRKVERMARRLRGLKARSSLNQSLVNREFAQKLELGRRIRAQDERREQGLWLNIQQASLQALQPPHGITSGVSGYDRVAGRYGIELRDPWGDRRVVDFFYTYLLNIKCAMAGQNISCARLLCLTWHPK